MTDAREIVVTGEGAAYGTPDRCVITLALNVMASTSGEALDQLGILADQVIRVLLEQGVERAAIQTLNISLQDWFDRATQAVTARVATYLVSISALGLERAGPLLAAVAPIAGNALQVRDIQLLISDPKPLVMEARRRAVEDALATARFLADAAGVQLGHITSIDDGVGARPRNTPFAPRAFASSSSAPVEGGTSAVSAQVTLTMAIED
jgi:uncharacterized protein